MPTNQQIPLGRFRLDLTNECLLQGTQVITLRPKVYAVLKHLVDHRGQLVTKQQLLDAVWPGTFVGDAVVKGIIRQLRETLGDDAESPQYIQTSPRRGYRFVGQTNEESVVAPQVDEVSRRVAALDVAIPSGSSAPSPPREVLGRDAELATLRSRLDRALAGERQVVFVTGEAGIGKTTLVDSLLHQAATHGIRMARGQCLDQFGAGEAYLPILDALSRLGRGPGGEPVVACLRQFAPAWLLELPSLIGPEERESAGGHHAGGATRERMLREIAEAIEAMTIEAPLIIVIEDLHWSDYSTLDLIAYLARRNDPARLMVIGTYRPVEVIVGEHPLKSVKRELQAHGLCHELPLEYLTEEAVAQYLNVTLPGHRLEKRLARLIYMRTEGNPLFMVNLVDYLIDEGLIVKIDGAWQLQGAYAAIESGVPDSVRQLIEKHIERLSPDERTVLEGASVVGMECSAVAIGAGLGRSTEWVEERCEALVRRHRFLSPSQLVELPDGTMTPRYTFSHVLYLEVPYRLLPAMRRAQIHLRIGAAGEAFYLSRVREIAAELAMHFEQGRDHPRAVKYLLQAAENARYRSAHHEAAALARRGLQAVETLPPSTERDEQELGLRLILGVAIMTLKGFAAEEVKDIVNPALELCARHRASFKAFMVQWLLGYFHYFRGEIELCRKIVVLLMDRAEGVGEPPMLVEGHRASGIVLVELGRYRGCVTAFRSGFGALRSRSLWHTSAVRWTASTGGERLFCGACSLASGIPGSGAEASRARHVTGATGRPRRKPDSRNARCCTPSSASRRGPTEPGPSRNRHRRFRRARVDHVGCIRAFESRLGENRTGILDRGESRNSGMDFRRASRRAPESGERISSAFWRRRWRASGRYRKPRRHWPGSLHSLRIRARTGPPQSCIACKESSCLRKALVGNAGSPLAHGAGPRRSLPVLRPRPRIVFGGR